MCSAPVPKLLPIQVHGLRVTTQKRALLNAVSCDISSDGISVIMGPNGAGKSLFLRCLHGLTQPAAGEIQFCGRPLDEAVVKRQSFVFQSPTVLRRTVFDNLAFVAGLRPDISMDTVHQLLAEMRLEGLRDQPARLLSGGEKQRLAMARALLTAPDLLLMDEATANLDPASVHIIETSLKTAAQQGMKIIVVTHDIGQARRLARDVLFFSHGRLTEHTDADNFFHAPQSAPAQAYLRGDLIDLNPNS